MAFLDAGPDGRFVGEISDPIPLRFEDGRYRLDEFLSQE
jgi:beta-fructofuranosidase